MEPACRGSGSSSCRCWRCWYQLSRVNRHRRYVFSKFASSSKLIPDAQDMVPIREVAKWRSYVNIAATTGRSLGGPIGGFLTDTVGWRW